MWESVCMGPAYFLPVHTCYIFSLVLERIHTFFEPSVEAILKIYYHINLKSNYEFSFQVLLAVRIRMQFVCMHIQHERKHISNTRMGRPWT